MTIEEAIKRAEETAIGEDELCKRYDRASGYSRSHDETIRTTDAKRCEKIAQEHRQLAEWLKDYKRLLENSSEIPTGSTNTISFKEMTDNLKITAEDIENAEDLEYSIYPLDYPKNDLAVDCVDKTELLKAMNTWDKFGNDPNKGLIPLKTPALQDRYVPYVKYDDMVNCVKGMPSVKPQEPRKGHWELVQRGKCIDICCSNCKATRIKEYAYNYTIDQLDKEDVKECLESDDMRYCPYCGSDNREVEE